MKTSAVIALSLAVTSAPAMAVSFLNQLPANGASVSFAYAAQDFESGYNVYDVAVIDDFSVGAGATVTSVSAVMSCFNANMCLNAVQNYRVEIYSSITAAASNLIGDIGSFSIAAGSATITNPYAENYAGLVTLSVNQALAAGTYWVGVIPRLDFGLNGQSGLFVGNLGGNGNAAQVNPNGGFGFPGNASTFASDGAYAVEGTLSAAPEPAEWALLLTGFAGAGIALRRRRAKVSVTYA